MDIVQYMHSLVVENTNYVLLVVYRSVFENCKYTYHYLIFSGMSFVCNKGLHLSRHSGNFILRRFFYVKIVVPDFVELKQLMLYKQFPIYCFSYHSKEN